tara:strand:+ start:1128 stop:1871 length:744 start_codon:yes stop_codon:yes gene_type:complete
MRLGIFSHNFQGRQVLVTGGTRGIGRCISKMMADAGAKVLITGTQTDWDLCDENINYRKVDFGIQEDLDNFLDYAADINFDICVNNAAINIKNTLNDLNNDDWSEVLKVNVTAPFQIIKEVSLNMKKNMYGRIVNISSLWSFMSASRRGAYAASKHALNGLTITSAAELAPYNVLVNSLSPGFVMTDMTQSMLTDDEIENITHNIPLKRMATPKEIATVACFLASSHNTYITGQNIIADGGFSTCRG